ncbi:EGF domain-specific O-linked N-acetylglucosamine transferase-like isoform X2 [Mya arenaria]|uniref:EGF domain-specific O-linked N-acetylglucosamine transferase-like isoform X2 n=1 Tax=Mya arenaria TaxID=6604 RepID=UPI0022E1FECB|nr:EGF domain-specific O-linked N-acetylglucosamine transferase-like isoform X2 [Mya arenaria]
MLKKMNWTFSNVRMRWQGGWLLMVFMYSCNGYNWSDLELPDLHVPYFFKNNPGLADTCRQDGACPYKAALTEDLCWGYESDCALEKRLSRPECPDPSRGWAHTKEDQLDQFWKGADFGYVLERRKETNVYCAPQTEDDSLLECAKYARYCRAKNIYLDFRRTEFSANDQFTEDFLRSGEIGGHCTLNSAGLKAQSEHKYALQSWYAEVEHFTSLPFRPINNEHCDVIIDKPVMFMKLDAGVNMFHHYCDFVNFYTSQHVNNSFTRDMYMINWDTSRRQYHDLFKETFQAFTQHPMKYIKDFDNQRVCIKDAVFPLLPRMRWGMFYNMPLIPGCYGSSLFQAFSAHLVHRLHIAQDGPLQGKIRITLLDRDTKFRGIMNQNELFSALKSVGEYEVNVVKYKYREMPFLDQVKVSHNSDIFIGMHGAGLTHMLYQPDWGAVIELYHTDDPNCYLDLARLRGVKYFTWEKMDKLTQEDEGHHPTLGAHKKFTNYAFEVTEFMRLVAKAADHVRSHPAFTDARQGKYGSRQTDEL